MVSTPPNGLSITRSRSMSSANSLRNASMVLSLPAASSESVARKASCDSAGAENEAS